MGKIQRKQNASNIWPLFGHFSGKILYGRLHATKPLKKNRPHLSYAAEESASWGWEPCLQLLVGEVLAQLLRHTLHKQHGYKKKNSFSKGPLDNSVADPGCLSRIPDPTVFHPGSRNRTVSIPDPGSELSQSRIPDANCLHPGSRIRIKEFKYFNPKKWFLSSRKYDPGCSSRIPDPDADLLPIPDPGSRGQKGTGSRILIRNTVGQDDHVDLNIIGFIILFLNGAAGIDSPLKKLQHKKSSAKLLEVESNSIINKISVNLVLIRTADPYRCKINNESPDRRGPNSNGSELRTLTR